MALIDDVKDLGETLNWVFMILFPNHAMARAFMDIYTNYGTLDFCETSRYELTCQVRAGPCCKSYRKLMIAKIL